MRIIILRTIITEKGRHNNPHTSNNNLTLKVRPLNPVDSFLQLRNAPLIRQIASMNQDVTRRQFGRLVMRVGDADNARLALVSFVRK